MADRHPIDPKRTGVKAVLLPGFSFDAPSGSCWRALPCNLQFSCPGCGEWAGVRVGIDGWRVVAGTLDDPTTLTLEPSILNHCCGWHGHLRNGVFESC